MPRTISEANQHDYYQSRIRHTIDVTEAAGFALLGMMETSCPVHSNIALSAIQSCSALHTSPCADATEFKETVEHRAIIPNIVFSLLLRVQVHIIRSDSAKKVDILVRVKLGHLVFGSRFGALDSMIS